MNGYVSRLFDKDYYHVTFFADHGYYQLQVRYQYQHVEKVNKCRGSFYSFLYVANSVASS